MRASRPGPCPVVRRGRIAFSSMPEPHPAEDGVGLESCISSYWTISTLLASRADEPQPARRHYLLRGPPPGRAAAASCHRRRARCGDSRHDVARGRAQAEELVAPVDERHVAPRAAVALDRLGDLSCDMVEAYEPGATATQRTGPRLAPPPLRVTRTGATAPGPECPHSHGREHAA